MRQSFTHLVQVLPRLLAWLLVGLIMALGLSPAEAGTVRHFLWDSGQRPLYQQCAKDFEASHPGIRIRIEQIGWDDYWTSLSTGFVSGTAADVFTNHLAKYAEFVLNGVMADLTPYIARDHYPTDDYEPGLLPMWQHQAREGTGATARTVTRQYALPTDWDTIALIVNIDLLEAAGLKLADLQQLDWNPRDGGSLGRVVTHLSIDELGRRGDQSGFDPAHLRVAGYQNAGPGGMMGQTEWSHYAYSNGWRFQGAPWDGALRYDDPALIAVFDWLATLPQRGISFRREAVGRMGADALFMAGRVVMFPSGSWMVNHFIHHARFRHAWVPLPKGPTGQRASMLNSLGLSIWSGSKNKAEAWQWVSYVGSRACQTKLAPAGIVYPAVRGLAQMAVDAQRKKGVDTQVFIEATKGLTFQPPIVPRAAEIEDLAMSTFERVLSGNVPARVALPEMARQVTVITRIQ